MSAMSRPAKTDFPGNGDSPTVSPGHVTFNYVSTLEAIWQPVDTTYNSSDLETVISSIETLIFGTAALIHGMETANWGKSSGYFEF